MSIEESTLYAFFSYKETQGEVIEDDLRDEHILNMQNYFNKFNIYVENLAENLFKIYFNKDKHSFLSNSSVLNYLKKILSDAGCNVSIGEESSFILDIYLSDEEYNSFVREYKTLTTSYSYNGVDSLNQFPDATIEDFRKISMFKDAVFVYNDDDDDEVQTLFSYSSKCECINCKSTNLICKVEKEFKNTVDENGLLYKGKILFKEMECSDCKESFHFLMKGGQIIMSSYIPVVPLSEYRFHILFEPESCGAFMMMFLKDEYNHAQEDNIRTENVLGLEEYFKHFHIGVHNEMENTWSFDFDPKKTDFEYDKKFVKFLTKKMKEAGATFDKTLDPDFEG